MNESDSYIGGVDISIIQAQEAMRMKQWFLDELVLEARRFGHDGDYPAVCEFVRHCFVEAGLPQPTDEELEPFPIEEEKDG